MALFHFHVTQIKRSAGQSAIAAAAYRAGEKLHSDYYGEDADYTRKGGVVLSEILLPSHVPPEYADRETLWNAVEKAERGKKAQLAYSFDIALQNEFSMEENIALARHFLLDEFVSRGMIVDFTIHQPETDGIENPHFHVLCPIRPMEPDGTWGKKQKRVYRLDENGNRLTDEAGHALFDAVPTTDWGSPERLEAWRQAWAERCNRKFAEKALPDEIDHRSFARQGLDALPTIHEGPTVRAMEKKGIPTDKGELNRWIKATNAAIRSLRRKLKSLLGWLKEATEELVEPESPKLSVLLGAYYAARNAGAYSDKAKVGNLKRYAEAVNYLNERGIYTLDDLKTHTTALNERADKLKEASDQRHRRMRELRDLLLYAEQYAERKPVFDEMNRIKFKKRREKFKAEHENELRIFYMARRKLKDHFNEDGKLPLTGWRKELAALERSAEVSFPEHKALRDEVKQLMNIRTQVEQALRQQERMPQKTHRDHSAER